ncbi:MULTISPECIES: nuclear transport factor 2 family protein [Nocardiaceae]|uniref:Nuclear transport factor 2 family protein n=1 Tax=Rhodococcoides yunnanense TaxID=278209 RepID=A0ABU4BEY8_9NOCA|nr:MULTISPECIES: nuclear transport factor 2 family protein [Rhodococcus]MDI9896135.1 nuclear transport factor 2 family protein [Rhodococcus sp. IEGM 1381]MDV6262756.1 nuclear transport factor 2 family protein [Rhodococcus yunnanensis]
MREDIIAATHTYALGLDKFDPKLALSAFAADAVWDATPVGLARYEGHEQILDFFERDAEQIENQFHIITNHIVHADSDTTAHGTNYVFSEGSTKGGAAFKAIALNEDTYVLTEDGWKISSRVISPLTPPQMDGFEA